MIKNISRTLLIALILMILITPIISASDIINALYKSEISITNSGSAASDVAVPFDLSTENMISGEMIGEPPTDAALRNASGSDMIFMPGYDGNPWVLFEPAILENESKSANLYSGEATDGEIAYFPGDGGMTTLDDISMELGKNFELEIDGFIDSSAGADKNIVLRDGVLSVSVDELENGTINVVAFEGFEFVEGFSLSTGSVSVTNDQLYLYAGDSSSEAERTLVTENLVDLTGINTIYIDWENTGYDGTAGSNCSYLIASTSKNGDCSTYDARLLADTEFGRQTSSLDVSGLSGEHYIRVHAQDLSSSYLRESEIYVYEIYLDDETKIFTSPKSMQATGVDSSEHNLKLISTYGQAIDFIEGYSIGSWSFSNYEDYFQINIYYISGGTEYAHVTDNAIDLTGINTIYIDWENYYIGYEDAQCCLVASTSKDNSHSIYDARTTVYDGFERKTDSIDVSGLTGVHYIRVHAVQPAMKYAEIRLKVYGIYTDTGISIFPSSDVSTLELYIDEVLEDSTSAIEIADNSNDWVVAANGSMPYLNYYKHSVDGVLKQEIEWQYSDTFADLSGSGNNANPTFRTTSSDLDVSAEVISLQPLKTGATPINVMSESWKLIKGDIEEPGKIYSDSDMSFIGAGVITEFAYSTSMPLILLVNIYAFGLALLAGLAIYGLTMGAMKNRTGSVFMQSLASLVILVYFVVCGDGVIPGFILLPFALEAIACILLINPFKW
jgi:hypothetical protein